MPSGTRRAVLGSLAALLLFTAPGCDGGDPDDDRDVGYGSEPADTSQDALDRLRALGYVDVADPLPENAAVGVVSFDRGRATGGLNLFTSSHACRTDLIDMDGRVLRSWSTKQFPCFRWSNTVLAPNGDLVVIGREPRPGFPDERGDYYIARLAWGGELLWRRELPAHHDLEVGEDGRILVLGYRHRVDPAVHPEIPVRDSTVLLLAPDGEVEEEVSLWDIMRTAPALFTVQPVKPRRFGAGSELDFLHANSVERVRHPAWTERFGDDCVLICFRHQDVIALFDWSERELLWVWGQGELSGPHDATVLAGGNVLVFDNGLGRGWSRVLEVDPVTGEIVWEHRTDEPTDFFTRSRGSNQRLSSGNTLVADSEAGRARELTPDGETVWEFLNFNLSPEREPSVIVRMRRYEGMELQAMEELTSAGRLPAVD